MITIPGASAGDITGVTAGVGLSGGGDAGAVTLTLDLSELSTVVPADGDFFSTLDSDGANEQKTSTTALATLFAGDGLAASNAVLGLDLVSNGGLEISSNKLQVATGISQYDVAQFAASVVDNDFLRIATTSVEGRSASEVLSDIGGQASLTFGISNTNAVKVDSGSVADDEYARFTASGLESRSTSEVLSDIGGAALTGSTDNTVATVTGSNALAGEANLTFSSDVLELTSSSASLPRIDITNTHDLTTSGEIRFNKNSTGDDGDIMGKISWYGTDSGDNAHEQLAYIDATITDSAPGSEAASLRFYVAENDATNTLGLQLAGQADADGEIDVTIGAGAASTATIAGTLTMGTTASMTNAGLLSVGNQTGITGLGTITSGVWNSSTVVASAYLDADTAHLTTNQTFTGVKTFDENIALTKSITFDSTPANPAYSGVTATFTAGEILEAGEVVYLKAADTRMWKAVSVVSGTGLITPEIMCVAMAAEDISAGVAGLFLLQGFLRDDTNFPTYAIGETLYVPEAEQSSLNVPHGTIPTTDGDFVQVIGWAADGNTVYFNPDFTIIEHA